MFSEERVLVALSIIKHIRMNRPLTPNYSLACDIRKFTSVVCAAVSPFCPLPLQLNVYFCFSYNEILISPEFVIHIMTLFKGLF